MPDTTFPQKPAFKPEYLQQKQENRQGTLGYTPSHTKPSLYEEETEKDAYCRLTKRIWHEMLPERQKYDPEMREVQDAYEGLLRMSRDPNTLASKVFPLVFMLVDAKLSVVLAAKPRAVFEHTVEKAKIPFIEMMYDHFTGSADDGANLDVVDYLWHWYNELYGWSIKRIWHEVDQWVEYDEKVETEDGEDGEEKIVYDEDGFAKIRYSRQLKRKSRVRHKVYQPDMVAVDPDAVFLYEADDIVFIEDMSFDTWSVKYQNNPRYNHTEKVEPGKYMAPSSESLFAAQDEEGNLALYNAKTNLGRDKVRVAEYYCLSRDEYAVFFNGILCLHIPNPTPPVNGKKVLPAADLHNRLRPGTFYSRSEGKVVEPIVVMWQRLLNAKARRAELAASPVVLTEQTSGLSPKSFKVMPGAHWKGMYGKAETLNLAGVDTGEVREYIELMRDMAKTTTGVDFDRFIAEPDPTAQQQMAREAAAQLRTAKDINLHESLGHVRSMNITVALLQKFIPIPEIAYIADASEEELQDIKDYDKIDDDTFYRYARIPLKDELYIDETYDEENDSISYRASKKRTKNAKDYFFARPESLRTKTPVRVRAVSDKRLSQSKQLRLELAREILDRAFGLPPKNEADIQTAVAGQKPPPKPEFYINRTKAVERFIDAAGEDPKEMMQKDEDGKSRPATSLLDKIFKDGPPTLLPNEDQQKDLDQMVSMMSSKRQKPSGVDLASAGVATPTNGPQADPQMVA